MSLYNSKYTLKVSFEDLDPMNVVWHGNYMRYMEQARCDMFSKLKYTYSDMKEDGYAYPVAKMQVKYIKPAYFENILTVETELVSVEPSININYKIFCNNEKIFEGSTMQIGVNINSMESFYSAPIRLKKILEEVYGEKV